LQIDSVGEESLCFEADNINWSWTDDVFHSAEQFRSIKTPQLLSEAFHYFASFKAGNGKAA
jgi:hypothetical protein